MLDVEDRTSFSLLDALPNFLRKRLVLPFCPCALNGPTHAERIFRKVSYLGLLQKIVTTLRFCLN